MQPLADKIFSQGLGPRILEHALDLRAHAGRGLEIARCGRGAQLCIRHGTPEEIGQARRQFVGVQFCVVFPPGIFSEVHEARRGEDGPDTITGRRPEILFLDQVSLGQIKVRLDFSRGYWPAKGSVGEPGEAVAQVFRSGFFRRVREIPVEARQRPLFEKRTLDAERVNVQLGAGADVHLRRIPCREERVLVILGQHLAQDALEGSVGAVRPMHMKSEAFLEPHPVFNFDDPIIGDLVFADDPVRGGAQLTRINRDGKAHRLVGVVTQVFILVAGFSPDRPG